MDWLISLGMSQIEDYKCGLAIAQVPRDKTSESLLPGCIPELQPDCSTTYIKIFRNEIDSNSRVMCRIELVLDKAGNYWAFAYSLIAYKYEFKFEHIFLAGSKTYLFILFFHFLSL